MKIGFDAKRAFENRSGLGNYSRDIITSLIDFYPENDYLLFAPNKTTTLIDNKYYEKKTINPNKKTRLGKSYWRSFSMKKDIKIHDIDIFHGLSNELPLGINKISVKKIVTIHDLIFLRYPNLYNLIDREIYKYKFRKACLAADKLIAISEQTKKDIIEYYKIPENKIEILYQSCNKNFTKKVSEEEKKKIRHKYNLPENFILSVGTIEQRKNILTAIKALYYYDINTNLVLVGRKTKYFTYIRNFIEKHKLNGRIFIIDNVESLDLPAIYQMAELFIYPSLYEGFGIPIIEAFNSGTPVITSNMGAMSEIGGEAAVLVNPLNSKEIGSALKSLMENSQLRNQFIAKGFERAKIFDREIICSNLMKIYKSL
jgi:glycosyltransferase involved in cell wall biosynthesis